MFLREASGPAGRVPLRLVVFTVVRSAQVAWLAVVFSLYASYLAYGAAGRENSAAAG